jgi:hypothetical protein
VILDGGHIFIGVHSKNKTQIIIEDIRNNNPPEVVAEHRYSISSLLVNQALNTFWAGDHGGNVIQYVLEPVNSWKIQARYSRLRIGTVRCLSLFGNLLFAGADDYNITVINTADRTVLPQRINTSIERIYSLQICEVSPSETYLTVAGYNTFYSSNQTDLFDISNYQKVSFAKKIFSRPDSHINSIRHQSNKISQSKEHLSTKINLLES